MQMIKLSHLHIITKRTLGKFIYVFEIRTITRENIPANSPFVQNKVACSTLFVESGGVSNTVIKQEMKYTSNPLFRLHHYQEMVGPQRGLNSLTLRNHLTLPFHKKIKQY